MKAISLSTEEVLNLQKGLIRVRRAMKPQPQSETDITYGTYFAYSGKVDTPPWGIYFGQEFIALKAGSFFLRPGEQFWVQEPWHCSHASRNTSPRYMIASEPVKYLADGFETKGSPSGWSRKQAAVHLPEILSRYAVKVEGAEAVKAGGKWEWEINLTKI